MVECLVTHSIQHPTYSQTAAKVDHAHMNIIETIVDIESTHHNAECTKSKEEETYYVRQRASALFRKKKNVCRPKLTKNNRSHVPTNKMIH